ncbi:MAG: CRISPR-associated helicase Cas3' [Deltaproteobacteria bacterium]|nr:CRISPR-associated helicase Cas3' [Deltaproteobacteria bacterium]
MFRNLVAFLRRFDVPVLCMTATLVPSRRKQLEEVGLKVFPDEQERSELEDLAAAEAHPRYRRSHVRAAEEALDHAVRAHEAGKRVLWVVNTVGRCQAQVAALAARTGSRPLCYHSRFRLLDRKRRHAEVVAAFKTGAAPAIAVTTQVCEMSLDLDADVLVTELAPGSSLVQRFGRANRHTKGKPAGFQAELIVYAPEKVLPYQKEDISDAERMLAALPDEGLSQRDLAEALEKLGTREGVVRPGATFLDSGIYAIPGSFRDEDAFGESAVWQRDVPAVVSAARARKPLVEWIIPVPARAGARSDEPDFPAYLRIIPDERYSTELGFIVEGST